MKKPKNDTTLIISTVRIPSSQINYGVLLEVMENVKRRKEQAGIN